MRKSILNKIKAELSKLTIANDYSFDVKKVTFVLQNIKNLNESDMPCIVLLGMDSKAIVKEGIKEWNWKVGLLVYFTDDINIDEAVLDTSENIIDDLIGLFDEFNPQIGEGAVSGVESCEIISIDPYLPLENGKKILFAELEIIYNQ